MRCCGSWLLKPLLTIETLRQAQGRSWGTQTVRLRCMSRLRRSRWMVERWVAEYGREVAMRICAADQKEPAQGGMFSESGGDLPHMDDGSRLVAELAAAAMPGAKRVWDCCAAPGGKTLILARRLGTADVVASDVSVKRLAQTEARLRRYAYAERVGFAAADAADARA